ncbi:hypothetical protein DN0286_16140 [Parabacteroides distasonis]|nr:hypothetical protein DN0286_16140 [Parabacteroides distasonis]
MFLTCAFIQQTQKQKNRHDMPFVNTDILINTILKVNKCDKDSTFHLFGTFRIDKINMNIDTQIVS